MFPDKPLRGRAGCSGRKRGEEIRLPLPFIGSGAFDERPDFIVNLVVPKKEMSGFMRECVELIGGRAAGVDPKKDRVADPLQRSAERPRDYIDNEVDVSRFRSRLQEPFQLSERDPATAQGRVLRAKLPKPVVQRFYPGASRPKTLSTSIASLFRISSC